MFLKSTLFACVLAIQPPAPREPAARPSKDGVPEHLAHPWGFKMKSGAGYMLLAIPAPMSIEQWEVYAKILKLSREQQVALQGAYDQYRRSDWEFRTKHVQSLYDRSAEAAPSNADLTSLSVATELGAIYRDGNNALPQILRIERAYFTSVAQFLAADQLEELEIVRMMRERSNERQVPSSFPGYKFDLDAELIGLAEAGVDVTPDDPEAFRQLMQAWRTAAATLYARHGDEMRRVLESDGVLVAEIIVAHSNSQSALVDELREQYIGLREPATRTVRRIHDLNKTYVQLVAERLPAVARQHLVDTFERSAYKPFFPDPSDLLAIFAEATEQNLTAEQRAGVDDIRTAWQASDQSVRNRMLADYLEWKELTNRKWSFKTSAEHSRYSGTMLAAAQSRFAGAEATIDALLEVLTKSQRRHVNKHVEKWREEKAAWLKQTEKIKSGVRGWPGPNE
jgi:hypothetical protein